MPTTISCHSLYIVYLIAMFFGLEALAAWANTEYAAEGCEVKG